MEELINIIAQHSSYAHWLIFASIILAGINLPVSIDLMVLIAGLLASQIVPEHTVELFLSIYVGCIISAWISYWFGRVLGGKLVHWRYFSKVFKPEKLEKIKNFYNQYGLSTLIIGRFIPFGIRNCIFMSAGMSQAPFRTFVWRDIIACSIWTPMAFFIFYMLGQNYATLKQHIQVVNCIIFVAFSVTVISVIWYKKRKLAKSKAIEENLNRE